MRSLLAWRTRPDIAEQSMVANGHSGANVEASISDSIAEHHPQMNLRFQTLDGQITLQTIFLRRTDFSVQKPRGELKV